MQISHKLIYRNDFFNLGQSLLEDPFNTHFHRHRCAGTASAGTLQANVHGIVLVYTDKLNIAAVSLKTCPDGLDNFLNLLLERLLRGSIFIRMVAAAIFTHQKTPIKTEHLKENQKLKSKYQNCGIRLWRTTSSILHFTLCTLIYFAVF
jgi:hypothetical protein